MIERDLGTLTSTQPIGEPFRPPIPRLAVRLESYLSFAGKTHGRTIPPFLGGELWF